MGLRNVAEQIRQDETTSGRCVVGQGYRHFTRLDPEAAAEMLAMLDPSSGETAAFVARVVTARLAELGVDLEISSGSMQNHRRKGCRCGTL